MKIEKLILAFIMFLIVSAIIIYPFKMVFDGFAMVSDDSVWGIASVVVGCILLRLIKPISIITGKDYKIF